MDFLNPITTVITPKELNRSMESASDFVEETLGTSSKEGFQLERMIAQKTKYIDLIARIAVERVWDSFGKNHNPETSCIKSQCLSEVGGVYGMFWSFETEGLDREAIIDEDKGLVSFVSYDDVNKDSRYRAKVYPPIKVENLKLFKPRADGFEGKIVAHEKHIDKYLKQLNEKISLL